MLWVTCGSLLIPPDLVECVGSNHGATSGLWHLKVGWQGLVVPVGWWASFTLCDPLC